MQKYGIKPSGLIHAMQNHDEITYELVHFTVHPDEKFTMDGKTMTGKELREKIVDEMHSIGVGENAPYNRLSGNGLCTTYTGLAAAALGIKDIYSLTAPQKDEIKKAHLLLAMYNAMQPGVFAVSGWDLVGALPLPLSEIKTFTADGDYRWINRGAYDLTGLTAAVKTDNGLPKAEALYGSLPEQLKDPSSFAYRLKLMLNAREKYGVATSEFTGLAETSAPGVIAMVNRLENNAGTEITVLNFGKERARENIFVKGLSGKHTLDIITGKEEKPVSGKDILTVDLDGWEGKALLIK
jgi:hypothetical protein